VPAAPIGNEEHVVSNIVIFRSTDGKTGYRQAESVEEAARFVERLRNGEGVDEARIYKLEEVVFEYKPYFRVEVGSVTPAPEAPAPAPEPASEPEATPEPVVATVGAPAEKAALDSIPVPTPVPVDAAGKRGLFSR
jgi:hypothetical protein